MGDKISFDVFKNKEGNLVVKRGGMQINSEGLGDSYEYNAIFLPEGSKVKVILTGWYGNPGEYIEKKEIINLNEFNQIMEKYNQIQKKKNDKSEQTFLKLELAGEIFTKMFRLKKFKSESL